MKEQRKQDIKSIILNLFKGLFTGFLSGVGTMPKQSIDRILKKDEHSYKKYGSTTLPYLLAFSLGLTCFFYIPFDWLSSGFNTAINCSLLVFTTIILLSYLYRFYKSGKALSNRTLISSIITFAVTFIIASALGFYMKPNVSKDDQIYKFILIIVLLFSSLLSEMNGLSIMQLIFIMNLFLPTANNLNADLITGFTSFIVCWGCIFVGTFIGKNIHIEYKELFDRLNSQSQASAIAILVATIILCATRINPPYFSNVTTNYANIFTLVGCILASLLVSVSITISEYPFFNRAETGEREKDNEIR